MASDSPTPGGPDPSLFGGQPPSVFGGQRPAVFAGETPAVFAGRPVHESTPLYVSPSVFQGAPPQEPLFQGEQGPQPLFAGQRPLFRGATTTPGENKFVTRSGAVIPTARPDVPNAYTYSSVYNEAQQTYYWQWDEAYRRSQADALAMRRDDGMMRLLFERLYPTIQMPWHIEIKDARGNRQPQIEKHLTALCEQIPDPEQYDWALGWGVWYGRAAAHQVWGRVPQGITVVNHDPVSGDKIQYKFDGTPEIMIWSGLDDRALGKGTPYAATTDYINQSKVLVLDKPYWRDRYCVYNHDMLDQDFFTGEEAGSRYGIGIRYWLYWNWWLSQEISSWMMDFLQRCGLGAGVLYYEPGNPEDEARAIQYAKEMRNITWIVWPRAPGDKGAQKGVERVDPPVSGVEFLRSILQYFDDRKEKFVVGQSLSSDHKGSGGLGGSGAAAFQQDTKSRIIRSDCARMGSAKTRDLLGPMLRYNYPNQLLTGLWKYDIDNPDPEAALEAISKACSVGVTFVMDEIRALIPGMTKPGPGDETVGGQQQGAPGQEGAGAPAGMPGMPSGAASGGPGGSTPTSGHAATPGGDGAAVNGNGHDVFGGQRPMFGGQRPEVFRGKPEKQNVFDGEEPEEPLTMRVGGDKAVRYEKDAGGHGSKKRGGSGNAQQLKDDVSREIADHNRIHGHDVASRQRPADAAFHTTEMRSAEDDLRGVLSGIGDFPVEQSFWHDRKRGVFATEFHVPSKTRGKLAIMVTSQGDRGVEMSLGTGGKDRTIRLQSGDTKEQRQSKIAKMLGAKDKSEHYAKDAKGHGSEKHNGSAPAHAAKPASAAPASPKTPPKPAAQSVPAKASTRKDSLWQAFQNLNLPNNREAAKAELSSRIVTAGQKARRYRGLYRRAATMFKKTGQDKYVKQMEMYRNSAIREQRKPAMLHELLAFVEGKPVQHQRYAADEDVERYAKDELGHGSDKRSAKKEGGDTAEDSSDVPSKNTDRPVAHTHSVTLGGRKVAARFNADGSERIEQDGPTRVITRTNAEGGREVSVEHADKPTGQRTHAAYIRGQSAEERAAASAKAEPTSDEDLKVQEKAESSERQRHVDDRQAAFEAKVGHEVLKPQAAIHTLRAAGLQSYQKPRPRAGEPGRGGIDVNTVPGKHTWLSVEWKAGPDGDDTDYEAKALAMEKSLTDAGYAVERSKGDPNVLMIRKPIRPEKHAAGGEVVRYSADDSGEGKWITIGGKRVEGAGKHVGGFAVKVSDDGTILAGGPKELHGKKVEDVKGTFDRMHGKAHGAEKEGSGKEEEHGPVGGQGHSDIHRGVAEKWVKDSPGLTSELASQYTDHLTFALGKLPPGIGKAAKGSLDNGKAKFHPDLKSLRDEAMRISGKKSAAGVVGFVHDKGGGSNLHLDGGDDPQGTYVHELWHCADEGGFLSDDKGFQAAYKKDVLKGRVLLSRYAMTNPSEGFAEFGRVLAARGEEEMAKNFPNITKHLKSKGLM